MERNQSARECRARKKLRYDYLDDLVLDREKTVKRLQTELRTYEDWCQQLDRGMIPSELHDTTQTSGSSTSQFSPPSSPENHVELRPASDILRPGPPQSENPGDISNGIT